MRTTQHLVQINERSVVEKYFGIIEADKKMCKIIVWWGGVQ